MLGASLLLAVAANPVVAIRGREVRLSDVATLRGFGPAAHPAVASRIIASIPRGQTQLSMTREALSGLVRRGVPGLTGRLQPGEGSVTFRALPQPGEAARSQIACAETAQPVEQGAALKPADIVAVPCETDPLAEPVRFDRRTAALRAAAPLAAGTRLGRLALPRALDVDKGDTLTLVSAVGPVRVERQVVALQAGRSGGRVFVRDAEGQVLAAPLSVEAVQ